MVKNSYNQIQGKLICIQRLIKGLVNTVVLCHTTVLSFILRILTLSLYSVGYVTRRYFKVKRLPTLYCNVPK